MTIEEIKHIISEHERLEKFLKSKIPHLGIANDGCYLEYIMDDENKNLELISHKYQGSGLWNEISFDEFV